MTEVLVVAELEAGRLQRATGSAVALANRVHGLTPGATTVLVAGHGVEAAAEQASRLGVGRVLLADHPSLADGTAETLAPTIAAAAADHGLTMAAATSFGRDLLPRVAARLDVGYVADCSEVLGEGGGLLFRRAIFAGAAWERCRIETPRGVVSVRQSDVPPVDPAPGVGAPIERFSPVAPAAAQARVELLAFEPAASDRPDLADARVVVAGGRMLRERFFPLLRPLAAELDAAIGATRAACDGGWAPGDLQVGQTGKIIAPELYVAVGISGSIQHVAGIRAARVIVAIDRDPEAPIFEVADYGLVADFGVAVPALTQALAARREASRA